MRNRVLTIPHTKCNKTCSSLYLITNSHPLAQARPVRPKPGAKPLACCTCPQTRWKPTAPANRKRPTFTARSEWSDQRSTDNVPSFQRSSCRSRMVPTAVPVRSAVKHRYTRLKQPMYLPIPEGESSSRSSIQSRATLPVLSPQMTADRPNLCLSKDPTRGILQVLGATTRISSVP